MSFEQDMSVIREQMEEIGQPLREKLADLAHQHGMNVSMNVANNLGTDLCAISMLALPEDVREGVLEMIVAAIKGKVKEGDVELEAEMAIRQAKGTLQ